MIRICVLGQGYVGLPFAIRAAEVGHDVIGFDIDPAKVAAISSGVSPVEDIDSSRLQAALAAGKYRVTNESDDLAGCDAAVISVPTPLLDRVPSVVPIQRACELLAPHLRSGCVVILESTSYPGTTDEVVVPLLESGSGLRAGIDFHVGFSPERVDPGNAEWALHNTPKLVAGINDESLVAAVAVLDGIVENLVPVKGTREAELAKLLENTFRHVNIALVNEMAMFAHELGIDMRAVVEAAATKPFGFMRFDPGPGTGGHCLPVDPTFLSWRVLHRVGQTFRFIELANDINEHMPDYVIRRLMLGLNDRGMAIRGSVVVLLGLAYKPSTSDARESPAVQVAKSLVELGAEVRAADPHVPIDYPLSGVTRVESTALELAAADAVVVLVDHPDFDRRVVEELDNTYVLDCRGMTSGDHIDHL